MLKISKEERDLWPSAEKISLNNRGLSSIPSHIIVAVQVTKIDLSGNALTRVPLELGRLENLKVLDLSNNPLVEVTPIYQLTEFILQGTQLKTVPGWIQDSSINKLDLENNPGLMFPDWFCSWAKDKEIKTDYDLDVLAGGLQMDFLTQQN